MKKYIIICLSISFLLLSCLTQIKQRGVGYVDSGDVSAKVREPAPAVSYHPRSRRIALVIGNSDYKIGGKLANPVNDAADMSETLKKLNFEVIHRENAKAREMMDAVAEFGRKLRKGETGLFYFAGHAVQINSRNYLMPVDAEIRKESDVEFEAVDADRILAEMYDAGDNINIVILDACRDNPFARSFRSVSRGLATMNAQKDTIIAYSTAPGQVAGDGKRRNGLYTGYLLRYITEPCLSIEQVFRKVRSALALETRDQQIPWESVSLTKEFYFAKCPEPEPRHDPRHDPPDVPPGNEMQDLQQKISHSDRIYLSLTEKEKKGIRVSNDIIPVLENIVMYGKKLESVYERLPEKRQELGQLKIFLQIREKELFMRSH